MYVGAIKKWAESNKLALEKALEIILAHELYHHLECTKLGLTSKQYMVPTLQIGRFKWGKSSILALSEIGAHGFAYTYYELQGKKGGVKAKKGLMNAAINVNQFRRTKALEAIYKQTPDPNSPEKEREAANMNSRKEGDVAVMGADLRIIGRNKGSEGARLFGRKNGFLRTVKFGVAVFSFYGYA